MPVWIQPVFALFLRNGIKMETHKFADKWKQGEKIILSLGNGKRGWNKYRA